MGCHPHLTDRKLTFRKGLGSPRSHSGGGAVVLVCRPSRQLRGAHLHCLTQPAVGHEAAAIAPALEESTKLSHVQRRPRLTVVLHCASHHSLQRPQQLRLVLRAAQGRACAQLRPQRRSGRATGAQPPLHLREGCGRRRPALREEREAASAEIRAWARPVRSTTSVLLGSPSPSLPGARTRPETGSALVRSFSGSSPSPRPTLTLTS